MGPDHDFKYRFKGEQWMTAAAYNLIWAARGIPYLYFVSARDQLNGDPNVSPLLADLTLLPLLIVRFRLLKADATKSGIQTVNK